MALFNPTKAYANNLEGLLCLFFGREALLFLCVGVCKLRNN